MKTLEEVGETELITRIRRWLPSRPDVVVGVGDDCAVVRGQAEQGEDWLLTSDPVIEGTHFEPGTDPAAIGHKAIGRILSDVAAMGGEPRWALIDIAAPGHMAATALNKLYEGAADLAHAHGLAIVGGDMAEAPALQVHVFAVGAVPRDQAVLRSGASPGDGVYVTGALGGAQRSGRHLSFDPRVREGTFLRAWASAMIDLSDGLAADLRHLIHMSGTGATLDLPEIPVNAAAAEAGDEQAAMAHVLGDGEDFELLFTVPAAREAAFTAAWPAIGDLPCSRIGVLDRKFGSVRCRDRDGGITTLEEEGFSHWHRDPHGTRPTTTRSGHT